MIDFLEEKKKYLWSVLVVSALGLIVPLSMLSLRIIEIPPGSTDGVFIIFILMIAWLLCFLSFYILMTVDAFSTRAFKRDLMTRRGTFTIWLILTILIPVVIYAIAHDWVIRMYAAN